MKGRLGLLARRQRSSPQHRAGRRLSLYHRRFQGLSIRCCNSAFSASSRARRASSSVDGMSFQITPVRSRRNRASRRSSDWRFSRSPITQGVSEPGVYLPPVDGHLSFSGFVALATPPVLLDQRLGTAFIGLRGRDVRRRRGAPPLFRRLIRFSSLRFAFLTACHHCPPADVTPSGTVRYTYPGTR